MVSGTHIIQKDHSLPMFSHTYAHNSPFMSHGGSSLSYGIHSGHSFGFGRSNVPKAQYVPTQHHMHRSMKDHDVHI
jgi:hypothetical protein